MRLVISKSRPSGGFLGVVWALGACLGGCEDSPGKPPDTYPRLLVRPAHKELVLSRLAREPYASLLGAVQWRAAQEYVERADPCCWDPDANGANGKVAQANAFLAWLFDDEAAAAKAREFLDRLQTDWNTNDVWDIDTDMPHTLMNFTNAWDLLMATPWFPREEAEAGARKITEITGQFADYFVYDDFFRQLLLGFSQNNHSIRTAAAIGYVAIAFPDHPEVPGWADWAFSELDYFWGAAGPYVLSDGGVSEGLFYYGYAFGVSTALFIAVDNLFAAPGTYLRDCRNRQDTDPWQGHGCVDGEAFEFTNPLREPLFHATAEWSISLRLPWGIRPPLDDGYFNPLNGNALLTSFGGGGIHGWDWVTNRDRPCETGHGADLSIHHLVYYDDQVAHEEPPFTTRFLPDAGNAVFRSDWSDDARWLLLLGEAGVARKTVHDHMDGTSFSLAAYGEYLLIDPGYYRKEQIDPPVTAFAESHNVVLINGKTTPDKGPLNNFGDADAFIRNAWDGRLVDYAEAHQDYQEAHLERAVAFVDGRYFVVCDRIQTDLAERRPHAWRLHGYAGYGSGGTFVRRTDGARWERELAGVDVFVSTTATGMAVVEPPFVEDEVPHVHLFDLDRVVTSHAVIDASVLARAPGFLAVLAPYRVGAADPGEGPLPVEALELGEGVVAWTIESGGSLDLALLREPGATQTMTLPGGSTLRTDGECVLLRLWGSNTFAVLVRGTQLVLDGRTLASATSADGVVVEEEEER